jgi:hypothetical protein
VKFGPFRNVPVELIRPAGFNCPICREPVRRAGLPVPGLVPRMMFYQCGCVLSVVCWEDEKQPGGPVLWRQNVRLARAARAQVVIFNGGKDTPRDFQGVN